MSDKIYLASPYSHDDSSIKELRYQQAIKAAGYLIDRSIHVFSPIVHSHPITVNRNLPGDWNYWREYDEFMIRSFDMLYVLCEDGWKESAGVDAEMGMAITLNKPVFYMIPENNGYRFEPLPGQSIPMPTEGQIERRARLASMSSIPLDYGVFIVTITPDKQPDVFLDGIVLWEALGICGLVETRIRHMILVNAMNNNQSEPEEEQEARPS